MKSFLLGVLVFSYMGIVEARDYPANNCEVWVDKVSVHYGYHAAFGNERSLTLFVKLDLDQLNKYGGVKAVKFKGVTRTFEGRGRKFLSHGDFERTMGKFFSDDYYQAMFKDLEEVPWKDKFNEVTGSFFVETNDGTRLWANARHEGGNFQFDKSALDSLVSLNQWDGIKINSTAAGYSPGREKREPKVENLKQTSDYDHDYVQIYNRSHCR